jgi:hypothetical protein
VFGRFCYKLKGPEHVAMVCDGQGLHAIGGRFFKQTGNGCSAIEQGKLGMAVEVCEIGHSGEVVFFGNFWLT